MVDLPSPRDLWALAAEGFKQKDKDILRDLQTTTIRLNDLLAAVEERKKECRERQWELKRSKGNDAVVLRDIFAKIATWIEKFIEVGDVAVTYDPGHAALPWAEVRFLLKVRISYQISSEIKLFQASVQDIQQYAAITEAVEKMAKLILRFRMIEKLHQAAKTEAEIQLEECLIQLYRSVLHYLVRVNRFLSRNTAGKVTLSFEKAMS